MKTVRTIVGVALALGALTLTGCAADPDVSGLRDELAGIDGVNGAEVFINHSGAPWNTQVVVYLYLDDPSAESVTGAVADAVPALAADSTASRHPVTVSFYDGVLADYADPAQAIGDRIVVGQSTYDALGVDFTGGQSVQLSPEDLTRLAAAS